MREVTVVKGIIAMLAAGSLALGAGMALAATPEAKAPEANKAPAVSTPAATSMEKEAKEPKAEQQAEQAKEAKETKAEQQKEKASTAAKKGNQEMAAHRIVRGEVTAVETAAKTLTVKTMRNKKEETVGVDVPDAVKITQGKATKTLADLKVGDHVWMKYDHTNGKLVADAIRILPPQKTAQKKS